MVPRLREKRELRYLAATAQLPLACRFDSFCTVTGSDSLNSLVLNTMKTPSSPAPASPVSVIFSPLALSKNGVEVTFLSTLPTPVSVSLLPAPFPPRYAQKFPAETTGSSGLPRQGAVAVTAGRAHKSHPSLRDLPEKPGLAGTATVALATGLDAGAPGWAWVRKRR